MSTLAGGVALASRMFLTELGITSILAPLSCQSRSPHTRTAQSTSSQAAEATLSDPQVFISISRVSHTFPGTRKVPPRKALEDVSLDIGEGEAVAFLGPNGSGKSTLLKVLMTSLRPSSGSVRVGSLEVPEDSRAVRRLLGVVFQKPALDIRMTVAENLMAAGLLHGMSHAKARDAMEGILVEVELFDRRDERVGKLSSGLSRRVELAKALLPGPRILVLDEPTAGLDPVARNEFWGRLERLRRLQELTVVASTHLMDEAERCNRVAVLHRGELLAFDSPERLQSALGRQVLVIRADDLEQLQRDLRAYSGNEGRIAGNALRLTLTEPIRLDPLLDRFRDRISALTLSHPSLDDVFVHYTGEHLNSRQGKSS